MTSKICLNAITTIDSKELYCIQDINSYTITEFLRPFEQTANLCLMNYRKPVAATEIYKLSDAELEVYGSEYSDLIDEIQL
ncbi:MAG: hypothetical protein NWP64_10410 [Maribacter sp.]|nr:hypothetical protein [Maribacter sp.]